MNKNQIELRNMRLDSVTENADGSFLVSGYVNETDQWSQVLGNKTKFKEKIVPGAFKRALEKTENVDFLYEHNKEAILANTKSGKLQLKEDERGLYMSAIISKTSWGKNAYELIKDGIVENMSFGFRALKDKVTKTASGIYERVVQDLELIEVTATRNPAYVQSSISARSAEMAEDINLEKEINEMTKTEVKEELRSIYKQGKELESQARKENRSLNEFEQGEKADLLKRKNEFEAKLELIEDAEQRNIIEIVEEKAEEEDMEKRGLEAIIQGHTEDTHDEIRALTGAKDNDGRYLIPTYVSNDISKKARHDGNLHPLVKKYEVPGQLKILEEGSHGAAGFVGEMQDVKANDFSLGSVTLDQKRVGTAIELSDKTVNDAGINVLNYSVGVLNDRLGHTKDYYILHGSANGTEENNIQGIVTYYSGTNINTIQAKSEIELDFDEIHDMMFDFLNPEYIKNAVVVMHNETFGKLLKVKDEHGNSLIMRDKLTEAPIRKLFGAPIVFNDNMDKVDEMIEVDKVDKVTGEPILDEKTGEPVKEKVLKPGRVPFLYGDFDEGYVINTKKDLHLQHIYKDRTSRKKKIHTLLLDEYMDGKILNYDCFALLKMADPKPEEV